MDSLTHIVLGAVVAETTSGKKIGNRALIYGAIAGNLPDFDSVFTPLLSPANALFFHRGVSHSFLLVFLLAPIFAFIVSRIDRDKRMEFTDWLLLIALPWLSHILVDIFNTYGTGIFEPFSNLRVSYDSMAIVDIFLLAGIIPAVVAILLFGQVKRQRRIFAWIAIGFVAVYISFSVIIKESLEDRVSSELHAEGKEYSRIHTAALPFSNLLWMVVVEDSAGYNVEQRNILNIDESLLRSRHLKNHQYLEPLKNDDEIAKLVRFTKGLYTVEKSNKGLVIYDLRYSSLAESYPQAYVFRFEVNIDGDNVKISRAHPQRSLSFKNIKRYVHRILSTQD